MSTEHDGIDPPRRGLGPDAALAAAIIGTLFIILIPLPPRLIDALLVLNITASFLILMTTACMKKSTDFNVFPSLLLMLTFFRLALNVATTRLILGSAHESRLAAAGEVVRTFADYVAGTNVLVGFIVFSIIVVVQFVVITKGTTRISEVAARFILDAMPGKQLSIDGELSSGLIRESEARARRAEIHREADFYGAMDGASKFVRGEAVASVVITLTNILGGLSLGVLYHGMDLRSAADVFARLTVGDGLVTQVPALMISVATALLITKTSSGNGLGRDVGSQLLSDERVFGAAGIFLLFLLPSGLPILPLALAVAACGGLGWLAVRRRRGLPSEAPAPESPAPAAAASDSPQEQVRNLLLLEPIELEIGYRLVPYVDGDDGDLMARLARVRERVAVDLGLVVPPVKVRDNTRLHPGEYAVKLRGNTVGRWRVYPGRYLAMTEGETPASLEGIQETDPATGKPGIWVSEGEASEAARSGYLLRTVPEIVTEHMDRIVRCHAAEILTREEVSRLVADIRERAPALVEELIPSVLKLGEVHKVLQNLLREQVSIRNLELILEALADHGDEAKDPVQLTDCVRRVLGRAICSPLATRDGVLHAALLDPVLEEFLQSSVEKADRGTRLAVEPEMVETLVESIAGVLSRMEQAGVPAVLVCSGMIRAHIRALAARRLPQASVLAYDEVPDDFRLEVHGSVALEKVC